ncbi:MAG: ornithine cyclodeaminase [gamma proteobacterium endosymbiont of Lamellibrachia anaximandri]|nr:ornithine cyclodeaminase [gamma proteobacterium endosymbiont of Lamellibrachia anaximandri]
MNPAFSRNPKPPALAGGVFTKSSRYAAYYSQGVIELMPCSSDKFYSFKYVNGHPGNTLKGKLSVVAFGVLSEVESGYPLLISEMTLLTAFRTAAVAALGAKYLARSESSHLALVGTGAQAEFMAHALKSVLPIEQISYFDRDSQAMKKFASNMQGAGVQLNPHGGIYGAVRDADMVVTATAAKRRAILLRREELKDGAHLHAMGGDCPGKTELDPNLVKQCRRVVEFAEQTRLEGEMQNLPDLPVHAELWEIVSGQKPGRENDREITLLDAVGFGLEDYSVLRVVYGLADEFGVGQTCDLIPELDDPKNLFGLLVSPYRAATNPPIKYSVR